MSVEDLFGGGIAPSGSIVLIGQVQNCLTKVFMN